MGGPLLPFRLWKQRASPRQMSPPDKVRKVLAVITSWVRSTGRTQASTSPGAHRLTGAIRRRLRLRKTEGYGQPSGKSELQAPLLPPDLCSSHRSVKAQL